MQAGASILLLLCLHSAIAQSPSTPQTAYDLHIEKKRQYVADVNAYKSERQSQINTHAKARFCANEELSEAEKQVDAALRAKVKAYLSEHGKMASFAPARPFYEKKTEIAQTELYRVLTNMPKGALLHAHLMAVGRVDWVVGKALASPNCYVRWDTNSNDHGQLVLRDPSAPPSQTDKWFPISTLAAQFAATNGSFSNALRSALLLDGDNAGPEKRPWDEFGKLWNRTGEFIRERSIFTNYLLDAFQTLWNDGVYYIELRDGGGKLTSLGKVDDSGNDYIKHFDQAVKAMNEKHKPFDCRLIMAGWRGDKPEDIARKMKGALELRIDHPKLIVGFDLIGEESGDTNLTTHIKVADVHQRIIADPTRHELITKLQGVGQDLPYFLHDGESAWADNENLVDAVTLAIPRIGHGFNLFRFPSLYQEIKSKNIALEICPISNQLLGLAPDLRLHPAAGYLNAGIQCTLSSDDPLWFGNDGLSYDFWEALIAWDLDLAALKKLARNSITYSGLDSEAKKALMKFWSDQWDSFIQKEAAKLSAQ